MKKRKISDELLKKSKGFPVISITGPRQSGKTTLAKNLYPDHFYANLEIPETREFASNDPKGFLKQGSKMIIDEIQLVPDLLSYIQGIVDEDKTRRFVISGSQNLLISEKVSQSLAGRVFIANLYPLSLSELISAGLAKENLAEQLFHGFYPRPYDSGLDFAAWYDTYVQTYLERDVRLVKNIENLADFHKFMGVLAGRTGQILNLTSLSDDVGISVPTVKSWLSVLEASFIIKLLQPFHTNWTKRLVKSPKLHFLDTGLVCALLKINKSSELFSHPLLGSIFESFVFSEFVKKNANFEIYSNLYYWRDKTGKEIDLILESGGYTEALEIKLGQTVVSDHFSNLKQYVELAGDKTRGTLVYGGDTSTVRSDFTVKSWKDL